MLYYSLHSKIILKLPESASENDGNAVAENAKVGPLPGRLLEVIDNNGGEEMEDDGSNSDVESVTEYFSPIIGYQSHSGFVSTPKSIGFSNPNPYNHKRIVL